MPEIIDNITLDLKTRLQTVLPVYNRMDVAVGYFNLRGWSAFDHLIAEKSTTREPGDGPLARILIGMVTTGPQHEALHGLQRDLAGEIEDLGADAETARARTAELLAQLRMQLMRGLPTAADRATLRSLRTLLSDGAIEIRVFTSRALHGKTYIFHRDDPTNPITGFVGSSNLTGPGLSLHGNLELNVDIVDSAPAKALAGWFEDRWNDPFSRPVTAELLDLLDESWARDEPRRPYEVFLKVCYDLSRDAREGLAEYSLPPVIGTRLLEYQATAVKTLARRVMTRQGTMLGDVVGLGKTLTAIAVALVLNDEHGFQPIVLCPKNLQDMWEKHLEAYELHGRVVPYTMAAALLPDMRRYPFVIVDESHTLRNRQRQDYQAIKNYISDNEARVLELTATPYNKRFVDVANQLGLYLDDDEDLGITPAAAIAADPRLPDKVDGKITTLEAFSRSEEPEDWKRLMSEHLVRRTRSFIKKNYASTDAHGRQYLTFANGTRFTFPQRRAVPIDHAFGANDPAAAMVDDQTLDEINALRLPRYDLGRYLNSGAEENETERELADNLRRSRGNVAGFVRTLFYKRLSSCGHSFILSLRRHLARNELALYAIENDLPIPAGAITENTFGEDEDPDETDGPGGADKIERRYQLLVELAPPELRWIRPGLFTNQLHQDLLSDTRSLTAMLDRFGTWDVERDSKLTKLIDLITTTHAGEKVLVFTEYKDTANYVAQSLRAAGIARVGVATGDSDDATVLAQKFSPDSNTLPGQDRPYQPEQELDVLIATDVLSEGQNLQDARIVINYDLPWAIIRLIQRAGRVDRVGQRANEVLLYSFFHQGVEAVIALRQRIAERLHANAAAFGSDEVFFGQPEEIQTLNDLYNGRLDDDDDGEDVDATSLAYEVWQQVEKTDPDLAKKVAALPDMISAVRPPRIGEGPGAVLCYVRTASGIDGFGRIDSTGEQHLLTAYEAITAFEAAPEVPGRPESDHHDDQVRELVQGKLSVPPVLAGHVRGVRRTVWKRLGGQLHQPDTADALDNLYSHPLTNDAQAKLKRAIRNQITDGDLAALVTVLHRDNNLVVSRRGADDPIHIVSSMGVH